MFLHKLLEFEIIWSGINQIMRWNDINFPKTLCINEYEYMCVCVCVSGNIYKIPLIWEEVKFLYAEVRSVIHSGNLGNQSLLNFNRNDKLNDIKKEEKRKEIPVWTSEAMKDKEKTRKIRRHRQRTGKGRTDLIWSNEAVQSNPIQEVLNKRSRREENTRSVKQMGSIRIFLNIRHLFITSAEVDDIEKKNKTKQNKKE